MAEEKHKRKWVEEGRLRKALGVCQKPNLFCVGNGEPPEMFVQDSNMTRTVDTKDNCGGRKSIQEEKDENRETS